MTGRPIGAIVPKVLLPRPGVDLHKWAVIACDQFTSEPEYWRAVANEVGDAPSTLHLILPEVYLDTPEEARRVRSIKATMQDYLHDGLFVEHDGLILVEREAGGKTRNGIMLALDLEAYDYSRGAASLIRATEGTILERIPPRVRIRDGAPLELPHILVLIDDPDRTVIEPLVAARDRLRLLYDTGLMLGSGHLRGFLTDDPTLTDQTLGALAALADPATFAAKYDLPPDAPVMLFAMGDGNHSLATAKTIWEQLKPHVAPRVWVASSGTPCAGRGGEHSRRRADVRAHSPCPVRRAGDLIAALHDYYSARCRVTPCSTPDEMIAAVDEQTDAHEHRDRHDLARRLLCHHRADPPSNLPVGTLQLFLDVLGQQGGFGKIDYVHGVDVAVRLGAQPGNWDSTCQPLPRTTSSRRSSWTVRCRARPFPWVKPGRNASTWRRGRLPH
jgi:hypothetical protein